jgi:hypothetical protein
MAIDVVIGVRLEGLPFNLKRQLFHRIVVQDCPQLITGYFAGDDLLVTQFSPTAECDTIARSPDPEALQPAPAGSSAFPFQHITRMNSVSSGRITDSELDAYIYENVTRFRQ